MDTSTPIMQPERKKIGRPSSFNEETATDICDRIANGESLRSVCRDPDMPDIKTVLKWLDQSDPERATFVQRYARARESRADALVEEALELVDDTSGDPARDRLRFDARRWVASKFYPARFGDRIEQHVSGSVQIEEVRRLIVEPAPRTIEGRLVELDKPE